MFSPGKQEINIDVNETNTATETFAQNLDNAIYTHESINAMPRIKSSKTELFFKYVSPVTKFAAGISGQTLPQAANTVGMGFPNSAEITKATLPASLACSMLVMILNEQAKKSPRAATAKKIVDGINAGGNTAIMGLQLIIAFYIEYLQIDKHFSGKTPVNRSNDYLYAFAAIAVALGALHTGLELSKNNWAASRSKKAMFTKIIYFALMSFWAASNLNQFGILATGNEDKEQGNINPWERTISFVVALALGVIITSVMFAKKQTEPFLRLLLDVVCSVSYLSTYLTSTARKTLGNLLWVDVAGISAEALAATMLAYLQYNNEAIPLNERTPLLRNSIMRQNVQENEARIEEVKESPNLSMID